MKLADLLKLETPEERAKLSKPPARCARCGEKIIPDEGPCDSYGIAAKETEDKKDASILKEE